MQRIRSLLDPDPTCAPEDPDCNSGLSLHALKIARDPEKIKLRGRLLQNRRMSRDLGSLLPPPVRSMIEADDPPNLVVPLISVDDSGLPHPALLSLYELIIWKGDLYFILSQSSRSSGYLEKRRSVVLLFVDSNQAIYLKGYACWLGRTFGQAVFRLDLAAALEDFTSPEEGPAFIVTSTRFEADPELIERRRQVRRQVRDWIQNLAATEKESI